ncbi:MAG: cation:proton antiporter [Pseudomonadota bacterium]
MVGYLTIAGFLLAYCMVANRLSSSIITAPMLFLGFGFVVERSGLLPSAGTEATLHLVAEITLIILLFLDAAQIDQRALLKRNVWPTRMLAFGLPLGFLIGTAFGWLLLPGWSLAAVALVAAILVPTDAALGQPVVSNKNVPERSRRAITVESGLNDGLALPLVLLMAAFAAPAASAPQEGWLLFGLKQITLGPLAGAAIGTLGAVILLWAKRTNATADIYEGIGAIALAISAYLAAVMIGGNGFIAAFAAGIGFGAIVRGRCAFVYEFTESEGQFLSWAAFFLLGATLVPEAIMHLTPASLGLILASLFIVRPLAIWLSLLGTDAAPATRLFFGWFGPRGLATALFALLVVDQLDHALGEEILFIAVNAVWISALLHGLTAAPGARLYATAVERMGDVAEMEPVEHSTELMRARMGGTEPEGT